HRDRKILEAVGAVVGPEGQDGAAAQDQPAAVDLYSRFRLPQVRTQHQKPQLPVGPAYPRYRLWRGLVMRAVDAAWRPGYRRRSVRQQYRSRETPRRPRASVDRLSLHHGSTPITWAPSRVNGSHN